MEWLFELNLQKQNLSRSNVIINQGNVDTVQFMFKILDGANEINYSNFTDARVTFSHNGRMIVNSPCTIENNRIIYQVQPEAISRPGTVTGQLDLTFDDGNLQHYILIFL